MATITINKKEYEQLKADKARIEYLETVVKAGEIKFLGRDFRFSIPKMSVRDMIDYYKLNNKL